MNDITEVVLPEQINKLLIQTYKADDVWPDRYDELPTPTGKIYFPKGTDIKVISSSKKVMGHVFQAKWDMARYGELNAHQLYLNILNKDNKYCGWIFSDIHQIKNFFEINGVYRPSLNPNELNRQVKGVQVELYKLDNKTIALGLDKTLEKLVN